MSRTERQIVDQTIELAAKIYELHGYVSEPGFRFWESQHPQELLMWEAACQAQIMLTDTNPNDALAELED